MVLVETWVAGKVAAGEGTVARGGVTAAAWGWDSASTSSSINTLAEMADLRPVKATNKNNRKKSDVLAIFFLLQISSQMREFDWKFESFGWRRRWSLVGFYSFSFSMIQRQDIGAAGTETKMELVLVLIWWNLNLHFCINMKG